MSVDRRWMYERLDQNGFLNSEFEIGVETFLNFAYAQVQFICQDKIHCPCSKCQNRKFQNRQDVTYHLCKSGFVGGYTKWIAHGECITHEINSEQLEEQSTDYLATTNNVNDYRSMVIEAMDINYGTVGDGSMVHPVDSEAWKHFDRTHSWFASDPRNVRLGLCPKSPGKSLDVFLRPLIDELKLLWHEGVWTHDANSNQNFQMKAALLWTISDFLAYGMLSGWSIHGRMSCPYCMENSKAFILQHGGKPSFFDCHRQFLPINHPYRRQKDKFRKYFIEKTHPPSRMAGDVIQHRVNLLSDVVFGTTAGKQTIPGFGVQHNWVKKSIFWELLYWQSNLLRHNLNVMHIEKNVFDNIFYTVMDVNGKSKDNIKAKVGGPVQYRWMYPFERYLFDLKKKVKNKAYVEGSIVEAYLIEEISSFCSHYFEPSISTRLNRVPRNDDGGHVELMGRLLIFTHAGRPFGHLDHGRILSNEEYHAAHLYVLLNCPEIDPLIDDQQIERMREHELANWLKDYVGRKEVDNCIYQIAQGPSQKVQSYKGYFVNGFKFHRYDCSRERKTLNSGVWVKGSCYNEYESDYYGLLNEVLELEYFGERNKIILFKYEWFDTNRGVRVHPQHGLVEINVKLRLASSDPFILAQQAHQVCYIKYPKINKVRVDWCAVFKTKARSTYNIGPSMVNNNSNEQNSSDVAYQDDDVSRPHEIVPTTELDDPTMFLNSSIIVEGMVLVQMV
ncbi:uncharacterized protein LOC122724634 [Manihot esculenta]|uniref:uncharacterized protein LOC122724634 n=1 Tax=Manihot esculenta TaxID=3983 RepID=UPI001CC3FB2F|nr:uncharacterized protein LOC122724634 [Manihot esculenta]